MEKQCKKCGKKLDNDFSDYCLDCLKFSYSALVKEKQVKKGNLVLESCNKEEVTLIVLANIILAVGIIASSEPDYFIVELQEEDVFLMASDGVYMDEIMSWMKNREKGSAKEQINCFMDILKKQIREDDSTILLAQVTKSKN